MAGKKTGKRLLTWVLVLVMALSLLPLNALAADGTIVYGGVTLYTEKRPQRYTFLRSNGENAVTKNVGDTGFYQRLPRDTYVHTSCGTVLAEFIPDYYSASTTTVELSDPTVLKDLSWTISGWNGNDKYKGFPCLTFNFTAAKPGTTTVKLTFYYNYDHGGESGYCNGCGGWVQYKANRYWWQETTTFTVTVTGEEEKSEYTLTYHENTTDPVTNMPDPKTVTLKSSTSPVTFTVSGNKPKRDDYTFLGWAGNSNATEPTVQPGNTITTPATTTNLYAVWQSNTPPTDKPAKPTENDVTGVVVDIVCVTTTGTHVMVQYPLGPPIDAQHTIGEVVSDGAGGYICPVTVWTAWFVQQASDLVWKVQHTQTASTITFNLTYDKNSETWVKPAANPRIEATHEVTPDTPDDTKPDFENKNVNIRVQCVEWPSKHDPYKKSYGILPDAYEDLGMKTVEGTYFYTIKLDRAKYIAQFDEDIRKPHTDTEPNEETYIEWRWENGAWQLIGGPDGVDADIKVKCGQTETPPEAPTDDELEKLEMAVQVKCVVDDSQQHKAAYDLLGKYDEDYLVGAPKKDGDDWLCDISYDPDLYVAEFNTTFQNLKHVQNDEKIVPVTLIWDGENWQIKTQGRVHVTEEYTVTFNAYGGYPTPDEQHVKSGEKAVLPVAPTLKGYTFAFWYLGEDEQNATAYDFDTPVTGDITLTAKWNINKYTVTFNSYGGTPVPPAQEVEYGLTATKPDDPTLKGHTFAFWYLGDDEENATAYDFNTPVTENITLTAKWNINKYTVTFNSYGGTPVPPAQEVEYGLTATKPDDPTLKGYTFAFWYLGDDEQNATAYDFDTPVTGDITLTAKWNINKYTVTFNSYGGTPVPPAQEVEYGLTATKPDAPTLKGYTFAFWYLGDDEQNATAYDFDTPVTENITLTAKWNINKYTVTFNSYGGTPVPPAQEVEYGLTATKPDDPTLKGYTFAFWYLGDDEQNATAYDFNTPVTENITLTAKWNINKYTVTFNSYGGTPVPPAQEVEYGLTATKPDDPTLKGYTFAFWYLGDDEQNATAYDFNTPVTENITLYANWKKNIYTVTYTDGVDGEEVFADQTYRVPFEDTTPAFKGTKTRDGYVFDGWKPAFSDTVTGNVTYVAQWTARTDLSYTVHYYLKNTTKQVANDKMVAGQTFNADVTENAIRISGYRVYGDSVKSITIGTGTNEIIFYYTRAYHPLHPEQAHAEHGRSLRLRHGLSRRHGAPERQHHPRRGLGHSLPSAL